MSSAAATSTRLILVKHAMPILDETRPAREWRLGEEGEQQARELATRLEAFRPFVLLSSTEPKTRRTAQIVAAELGIDYREADGLHEIDRPALPIVSLEEHERMNRPVFEEPSRPMLGDESADAARDRFAAALDREVASLEPAKNLIVVTHGTVMALFVGVARRRCGFQRPPHLE